jgi:hypothetical protein
MLWGEREAAVSKRNIPSSLLKHAPQLVRDLLNRAARLAWVAELAAELLLHGLDTLKVGHQQTVALLRDGGGGTNPCQGSPGRRCQLGHLGRQRPEQQHQLELPLPLGPGQQQGLPQRRWDLGELRQTCLQLCSCSRQTQRLENGKGRILFGQTEALGFGGESDFILLRKDKKRSQASGQGPVLVLFNPYTTATTNYYVLHTTRPVGSLALDSSHTHTHTHTRPLISLTPCLCSIFFPLSSTQALGKVPNSPAARPASKHTNRAFGAHKLSLLR